MDQSQYAHLFPAAKPPFGVEAAGGSKNRPEVVYPEDDWHWPDLTRPIHAQIRADADGVTCKEGEDFSGTVTARRMDGVKITSEEGTENGIYLDGQKDVTISGADIRMSGTGQDDFGGVGAGVMLVNGSEATLEGCRIEMSGAGKSCFMNTKGSTLVVKDCELISHGGPLPEGYTPVVGPGMLEPPVGLGIGGNARASLTCDHGKTYYYNTKVTADGWAALSTDAALDYVYLEANNCEGHMLGDGYVVYSDGDCHVVINGGTYTSGHYFGIVAGLAELTMNNVTAQSDDRILMIHDVMGVVTEVAELKIYGGSYESENDFALIRSANTYLDICGAEITAKNGVLIRTILNPDEDATPVNGQDVYGNNVMLTNMRVCGDVLNEDPQRTLSLVLTNTAYCGKVADAYVTLDAASSWHATGDSRVVLTGAVRIDQIDADAGVNIEAWAGENCTLSGAYALKSGGSLTVHALS